VKSARVLAAIALAAAAAFAPPATHPAQAAQHAPGLGIPQLLAPAPASSWATAPRLTWQAVPEAAEYRVEMSKDPAMPPWFSPWGALVTQAAWQPTSAGPGTYYWPVTALGITSTMGSHSAYRQVLPIATFSSARSGTLVIRVVGSARAIIDGVAIGRQ
jgi:hypothetical protein